MNGEPPTPSYGECPRFQLRRISTRSIVAHGHTIEAELKVELAHGAFARFDVDFLAVLSGGGFVGICARRQLAADLGSRYGFALNASRPVRQHLMAQPLLVDVGDDITELFKRAAARGSREFYDDVALLDQGRFAGMISMRTLVQLQTEHLLANMARVEASRREIAEKNRQIEEDLAMAHEVQLAMLPERVGPFGGSAGSALAVAHQYLPAGGMSGDFYHVRELEPGVVGLLICDVMGHGVRSALITAMVCALLEGLRDVAAAPAALLTRLNRELGPLLQRSGRLVFVTAAYVVIDVSSRSLRYAQAGHPTPLHWRNGSRRLEVLACDDERAGPALGLMADFAFAEMQVQLERGDRVLLFTDGVIEALSPSGQEFGLDRLCTAAADHDGRALEPWLAEVVAQAVAHAGQLGDDACLVAAEVT